MPDLKIILLTNSNQAPPLSLGYRLEEIPKFAKVVYQLPGHDWYMVPVRKKISEEGKTILVQATHKIR